MQPYTKIHCWKSQWYLICLFTFQAENNAYKLNLILTTYTLFINWFSIIFQCFQGYGKAVNEIIDPETTNLWKILAFVRPLLKNTWIYIISDIYNCKCTCMNTLKLKDISKYNVSLSFYLTDNCGKKTYQYFGCCWKPFFTHSEEESFFDEENFSSCSKLFYAWSHQRISWKYWYVSEPGVINLINRI